MNFERFKAGFESLVKINLEDHGLEYKEPYIYECNIDYDGDGWLHGAIEEYDLYFVYTVRLYGRKEYLSVFRSLGGLRRDAVLAFSDNKEYLKGDHIVKDYRDGHLSGVPWAKDFPCNEEEE